MAKPKKSVTRTIRLDPEINDGIEQLAYAEGVSVSFIVNKTLRKHLQWDHLAEKYGSISILKDLVNRLMDAVPESQIEGIARWAGEFLFKDFVLFWFKKYDVESIVIGLRLWSGAGNFEYEEKMESSHTTIVLRHDQGRKWSLLYGGMFRAIFQNLNDIQVDVENMEDEVLIRIPHADEDQISADDYADKEGKGTGRTASGSTRSTSPALTGRKKAGTAFT